MSANMYEDILSALMREMRCTRGEAIEMADTYGAREVIESGGRTEYTTFTITNHDAEECLRMVRSIHPGSRKQWSRNRMNLDVRGLPRDMPPQERKASLLAIKAIYREREEATKSMIKEEVAKLTRDVIEEGAMKPTPKKETWEMVTKMTGDPKNKRFYMKVMLSWVWDLCTTMLEIYYPDNTMDMSWQLQCGLEDIITKECTPDNLERTLARVWGVYTRLLREGPSCMHC